jgi:hypothetical protein
VAVVAEAGHLIASYVEWPGSAARGASHVAAGAVLGLVAAAVVAGTGRRRFVAGAVVALAGPVWWLGGVLLGAPPYDRLPVPAAIGIAAGEIGLAALLLTAASRTPDPDASAGVVRPRAKTRTGS